MKNATKIMSIFLFSAFQPQGTAMEFPKADDYREAADQGDLEAQCNLGLCYERGLGVARDLKMAVDLYRAAAEKGYPKAQFLYGLSCERGIGREREEPLLARAWYRRAAELGHSPAQHNLAFNCQRGAGGMREPQEAFTWYHRAATHPEHPLAKAQFSLGLCFAEGIGVEKDLVQAFEWYCRAAARGDIDAQYNVALCYEQGIGVEKDLVLAATWYRLKYAQEKFNYGIYLEYAERSWIDFEHAIADLGTDVTASNFDRVIVMYRERAKAGNAAAMCFLGLCHELGKGVEMNQAQAVEWYVGAAATETDATAIADARYNLGCCYELGRGVGQDIAKAQEWYEQAVQLGHPDALDALEKLDQQKRSRRILRVRDVVRKLIT